MMTSKVIVMPGNNTKITDPGETLTKPCSYYDAMKPIFWGLRLLFKFPYHLTPQGIFRVRYDSFWMLYSLVLFGGLCYPAITLILDSYMHYSSNYSLDELLDSIIMFTFLSFHFNSPMAIFIESHALVHHLNSWKEFEEEYEKETGQPFISNMGGWVRTFTLMIFPFLVLYITLEYPFYLNITRFQLCVVITVFIGSSLYLLFFVFTCQHSIKISRSLKNHLRQTLHCNPRDVKERSSSLANQKILWVRLSEQTQDVGSAIGRTLMTFIGFCIFIVIMSSYNILVTMIEWDTDDIPSSDALLESFYTFSLGIGFLYTLSAFAHAATEEVGRLFLHELFNVDMSRMDIETKFTIIEFIHAICINKPTIDMGGFFIINRKLFISYLSSTLTYLIALGQFRSNQKKIRVILKDKSSAGE